MRKFAFALFFLLAVFDVAAEAQTGVFTYQGRLTDSAVAASGTYEMQFKLFDTVGGPTQIGPTVTNLTVLVTNGVFTVDLNFAPATPFATGADRFLEIAVRNPAHPLGFTTLSPRQQITSSPYSIRTGSASSADTLSVMACISCVQDSQINSISGSKVTGIVANATNAENVTGIVQIANGGTGSSTKNFVDLSTNQTVSGRKTFNDEVRVTGPGGFIGNGSGLENVTATNVTGVVQVANGGTGSAKQNFVDLTTNQAAIAGDKTFTGAVGVSGGSGVFNGNGSGLTNLNGANINANSVTTTQLSAETQPNSTAFKLLGSLRWDLLKGQATFPVGSFPRAVAFDGANIWVANLTSNNVTKLRASDGTNLGTFPVGSTPSGVAFDGANIWVVNNDSNNVTKLRASDGANLGTFPAGTNPVGVAFDGANIWVTNVGSNNVTKLRASDGANLGTFPAGVGPFGIAFDGANMWVANLSTDSVTKLRASDGSNIGTFPVGDNPFAIAFDGANIWVANSNSNNLMKLKASDGANLGIFSVFPAGTGPIAVAFDGANIWVANLNSNNVTKLRASDGVNLGTFPAGTNPRSVAFDGANIWVTNSGSDNVTRLLPAFPGN